MTPVQRYMNAVATCRAAERELHEAERELHAFQQLVRDARRGHREAAVCGTEQGYYRHIRKDGEAACVACMYAHAMAERTRRMSRDRRRADAENPQRSQALPVPHNVCDLATIGATEQTNAPVRCETKPGRSDPLEEGLV